MTSDAGAHSLAGVIAQAFLQHRAGEPNGMDVLVDAVAPLLWHTARSQGIDRNAAEDVVQTCLLRLIEHSDQISEPQAVLQWLLVTTRREAWAVARRAHKAIPHDTLDEVRPDPSDAAAHTGPAEAVDRSQEQQMLWRHIGSLDPRCQQLLHLIAFVDRPDYDVVSSALGMPVGSIGPTRGRCLAKLRRALLADPSWEVVA